jgi:site-specific recombinase XerD
MTDLRSALERYLSMRQGLGYKYQHQARRLADFVAFMEKHQATTITTKLAMAWATLPPNRHASWILRLTDIRGFARHLANIDPQTEVPPVGILPRLQRAKPYVYSDTEINRLLAAALALPPANGLRRWTYHYLFGLIVVTGMRLSEAINLQRDDVDLEEGVVTVQCTKFGKSRLLPLHPTTCAALRSYAERRDAHLGSRCGTSFFVAERGGRLLHQYVHRVFWRLSREIGLRRPDDHSGPARARLPTPFRHPDAPRLVSPGNGHRAAASGALNLSRSYMRARHLLVPLRLSGIDARSRAAPRSAVGCLAMKPNNNFAMLIERYFTERLMGQRDVSANTIASYRDTFRLLLKFAKVRLHKLPSALTLDDLDAPFISAFLEDLETNRSASTRTRNLRLTAIRSFFRFVSFEEPAYSAHIQRVLAIPSKRCDKREVNFLTRSEIEAILAAPDQTTWFGRRDHTLLLLAAQTGLRLSELISLERGAVHLGHGAHVRCVGKGRKEPVSCSNRHQQYIWSREHVVYYLDL